jgi:hypothetical protein
MSPPVGFAEPNVTLCVPPAICHVTEEPGATVIFAGEKLVPTVVITLFVEDGEDGEDGEAGVDGFDGFAGFEVVGFGSTAAPPPPHPRVRALNSMTARFISCCLCRVLEKRLEQLLATPRLHIPAIRQNAVVIG